jgi:DNA recombination protein RmuC
MEYFNLIVGIVVVAAVIYLIYKNSSQQAPKEDPQTQKLFLEMMDAMRREFHDSANKSRQEILETSHKTRQEMQEMNTKNRHEMLTQLEKVNDQLFKGLTESGKTIQTQFKHSQDTMKDLTERLTKLDETNKQVMGFTEQVKSLEKILSSQKQRGILGEIMLDALLGNILPPDQYQLQYPFENGDKVDAVIHFKDKLIPIDAKFSLENYNKIMQEDKKELREKLEKDFKNDIKKTIDQTSKYIRPKEDTTDFAFMFIPAEGIYYNLLAFKTGTLDVNSQNLIEYAFEKHVIIVSPTTFSAYLQTVLQGLKAVEMEKNVLEIIKRVGELTRHLKSYEVYMQKLGNNLGTTVNMYNSASKEFTKIDKDVVRITDGKSKIDLELPLLEKPQAD